MNNGSGNIWFFFVKHFRFTLIMIAAIVLFGMLSIVQLPKESNPEVDVPVAVVTTAFPGAGPLDVEELVTDPIEDKVQSISGISSLTSVSRNSISTVVVEFDVSADREKSVSELNDAVDQVIPDLPDDAEEPLVQEVSFDDEPILIASLGGPYTPAELTRFAERLQEDIEGIANVSRVRIFGGQSEEIQVIVDKAKLDQFNLGITQVTQAISRANSDVPIGAIETNSEIYNLRFAGRIVNPTDISQIPIASVNDVPVVVSDVALVRDTYAELGSLSRMSTDNTQSQPAVTLNIYKSSGGDITNISKEVQERANSIIAEEFPDGVEFLIMLDLGDYIEQDLTSLSKNGLATVAIVFLVLWLFLGLREAVLASLSIPLVFFITLTILNATGYTLNFMTLFSLILVLGILVDSAIVISEAMNKKLALHADPIDAAKETVREYQWPLIAGTMTTVFAFLPMLLTSGIIGEFIKSIPVTVTSALMGSLFVGLSIITTMSAVFAMRAAKKKNTSVSFLDKPEKEKKQSFFVGFFDWARREYEQVLRTVMPKKGKRRIITWSVVALMIVSFALPAVGALTVNMFPTSNEPQFVIDLKNPVGTTLTETADDLSYVEQLLFDDERVESFVSTVGSGFGASSVSRVSDQHKGYITVNLSEDRDQTSAEIVNEYQEKLLGFDADGTFSVSQGNFGPPQEAPVVVTISGDDLGTLEILAQEFERLIASIEGTTDVRSSIEKTNGEFVMYIDRTKAQLYGVSTADVAFILRNAINGVEATSLNRNGDDVGVIVRYALDPLAVQAGNIDKTTIDTIRSLTIATPQGDVPLSSFAEIRLEGSRSSIEHDDGERITKILSFVKTGFAATEIFAEIDSRMDEIEIPDGYTVQLGGENEDINESFADMFRAMVLAIFLIAALLVLQFDSFKQAFIILVAIPLAMIGVFPGLALLNLPLSFPGIIGMVALVGIVVNNAIILIDKINTNRKDGMEMTDAIIGAGKARLEPIILTTITTVLGILPLALSDEVWASLGFAIVFGLLFSTVLTLLVIPLLYQRFVRS